MTAAWTVKLSTVSKLPPLPSADSCTESSSTTTSLYPPRWLSTTELHAGPNFKIRPDPAHENRDPTRPANIPGFLDPTRPDPMTIHDKHEGFIIARCTLSSAYTQVTSSMKSASMLRTYQIHVPSVRTHRDLHAVAALYQLLPETLHCDD